MAEGLRAATWTYLSHSLCQTANLNRDSNKRRTPFEPDEFNPYRASKPAPKKRHSVGDLVGALHAAWEHDNYEGK